MITAVKSAKERADERKAYIAYEQEEALRAVQIPYNAWVKGQHNFDFLFAGPADCSPVAYGRYMIAAYKRLHAAQEVAA